MDLLAGPDLLFGGGAIALALLGGIVFAFLFRKGARGEKKGLRKVFADSLVRFFIGVITLETLALLLFFPLCGVGTTAVQVTLLAAFVFLSARLVRLFSPSFGMYFLVHVIGWTAFVLYFLEIFRPVFVFLQRVTFTVGVFPLSLLGVLKALLATGILWWGALFISNYFEQKLKKRTHLQPSLSLLFSKALKTILLVIASYIGLSLLGVDLSALSIFAGAVGVGIAFGLQNILSNFFSGFILLIDRSIKPGDVVSLGEGKIYGIVNKLHARYVSVRTREGKEHLIPNQEIISQKLENWSFSDPFIRMEIGFTVSFDSDLERVEEMLVAIARSTERVMKESPPYVRFCSMVGNAVELKLRVWVRDPERGTSGIQSDIVLEAWKAFRKEGIRVPYPPREIIARPAEDSQAGNI